MYGPKASIWWWPDPWNHSCILSCILSSILSCILSYILSNILPYILSYILSCIISYILSCILCCISSYILSCILSCGLSSILSYILSAAIFPLVALCPFIHDKCMVPRLQPGGGWTPGAILLSYLVSYAQRPKVLSKSKTLSSWSRTT